MGPWTPKPADEHERPLNRGPGQGPCAAGGRGGSQVQAEAGASPFTPVPQVSTLNEPWTSRAEPNQDTLPDGQETVPGSVRLSL